MNQPMSSAMQTKRPGMVTAIVIMTLIDGVLNVFYAIVGVCGLLVSTFGLGIFCAPLFAYPIVLGILEIVHVVKLMSNPPAVKQPAKWLAIMQICNALFLNVISLIAGVLALVFYNDPAVQAYFAMLNEQAGAPLMTGGQQA